MPLKITEVRSCIRDFDFRKLFIENLGWDNYQARPLDILVNETNYVFEPIAEKRGMVVLVCQTENNGRIPEYPLRLKLERQLSKFHHEHLVIFIDHARTRQTWQWVRKQIGTPFASREYTFYKGQTGDALIHRLQAIAFDFEDEEGLSIVEVASRTRQAFDVERVTKKFYDLYKKENSDFMKSIKGIKVDFEREWYASLMLDRLMFIYFIQKKRFLDGDPDYLRNKLNLIRAQKGKDKFLTYYRHFLIRLFHEGLGARTRSSELDSLLGDVPYLNGGLFEVHELERNNSEIQIPDESFERIFDFFDQFQWYLDDRPLRADNEINPDVLGYIFEKYVNQKEMGAYYTKDDITGYMAKSIIVPFLFNAIGETHSDGQSQEETIKRILVENPDRYIPPQLRNGVISDSGQLIPLPEKMTVGLEDASQRGNWNETASPELRLPSETWRDYLSRRQYCLDLRRRITDGEMHSVDQLVTYNVDVKQLAEDYILECNSSQSLLRIYQAIRTVRVLDPTCGSGAFLFQVLNILESLYDVTLDQMEKLLHDSAALDREQSETDLSQMNSVLKETRQHPNRTYFVLKSIILNNLFGVDIMEEATEICKLRLFLKLAAQIEPDYSKLNFGLEPLPDIDFNIRCGNALVGFTSYDQVRLRISSGQLKLGNEEILQAIEDRARLADNAFQHFRDLQRQADVDDKEVLGAKAELEERLRKFGDELDRYISLDFRVDAKQENAFNKWRETYKPFHWLLEFYGIMKSGGFDVIIGNPPYVSTNEVPYEIPSQYKTASCRNLFALTVERAYDLVRKEGRISLIIPLSATSTETMTPLKNYLFANSITIWSSYYSASDQPASLFTGVRHRLMILIAKAGSTTSPTIYTTRFIKWFSEERPTLFSTLVRYHDSSTVTGSPLFCKISTNTESSIMRKILGFPPLSLSLREYGVPVYYHNAPVHWGKVFNFVPLFRVIGKKPQRSSHIKEIFVATKEDAAVVICLLNSSLFYWFNWQFSNCRDLSSPDIARVPVGLQSMPGTTKKQLSELCRKLMADFKENSEIYRREVNGVRTEFDSFYPAKSKVILDEIDKVLGNYYGFTPDEVDFIINYDLKYRVGQHAIEANSQEDL